MGESMLKLGGKVLEARAPKKASTRLFSVTMGRAPPNALGSSKAYLVSGPDIPSGFVHYLLFDGDQGRISSLPEDSGFTVLPSDYNYLGEGDVIRLTDDVKRIRVLFRAASPHNSFLVTERCNHYCLMCSQPPKDADDSWLLEEIAQLIPLIPKATREIGFTGGEPTLHGMAFLRLLLLAKSFLPKTAVHILSNGRRFSDAAFATSYAQIDHPDMMVGIPLYSDDPSRHDYIVQARGAFDETIRGILNLKELGQRVEIRVVLHKQSIGRLPQLAEFLVRNLLFVDHVALMGLEMTGFTRANRASLWIDPYEYRDVLSRAVDILSAYGLRISVYNHQLCIVNPDIHQYCRKSISDWKNEYVSECNFCVRQAECGGFFSSSVRHGYSQYIRAFR